MDKVYYKSNNVNVSSSNSIFSYILITGLAIVLLFMIVWFLPSSDKSNYRNYKAYESKIEKKLSDTIASTKNSSELYYKNQISRRVMIAKLKEAANKLTKLYDDFKWKRGDAVTKQLFTIKKQIIINYAQIYEYKAKAMERELPSTEQQELIFIQTLQEQYLVKDRYQKERFKLPF